VVLTGFGSAFGLGLTERIRFLQDWVCFFRTGQVFRIGSAVQDRIGSVFTGDRIMLFKGQEKMKLTDIGFHLEILSDIGKRTLVGFWIWL
jgi:hypothetical protein